MHADVEERILKEAVFALENLATVRKTAEKFGVSKSTVHKDLSQKLYYIDRSLYNKVRRLLDDNLETRHLRGGEATKNKYLKLKPLWKQK